MPAPVSFSLALAPLPVNFSGTPQQFAQALVDRLTISPSAPWSSFQNGGSIPGSDQGPVLLNGTEWRVFDTGMGAYTYHVQNGAGIVNNTITLAKLASDVTKAKSAVIFDASGVVTNVTTATNGYVLTQTSGGPAFQALPTPVPLATANNFQVRLGTAYVYSSTTPATTLTVPFDTVSLASSGVTFNTSTHAIALPANSVWYLYTRLQVSDNVGGQANVAHYVGISPVGATTPALGGEYHGSGATTFAGCDTGGIVAIGGTAGSATVTIESGNGIATGSAFSINTDVNTFFGGFRLL